MSQEDGKTAARLAAIDKSVANLADMKASRGKLREGFTVEHNGRRFAIDPDGFYTRLPSDIGELEAVCEVIEALRRAEAEQENLEAPSP